jgi:GTP-binding protein
MGGPNGGDGGKGGDVWLVADRNVASLIAFATTRTVARRTASTARARTCTGRRGEPLEVMVPEGTIVSDLYTGEMLADLANSGRSLARRCRRPRWSRQREVPLQSTP